MSAKTTVCNILDYGGVADNSTDVATAINSAFTKCVKPTAASRLFVPSGNYLLATTVTLNGGTNWALQLDGVITASFTGYTAGTLAGTMLVIESATDFDMYSSNKEGAFQGHGYIWRGIPNYPGRSSWPRILRFIDCTDFSAHDRLSLPPRTRSNLSFVFLCTSLMDLPYTWLLMVLRMRRSPGWP